MLFKEWLEDWLPFLGIGLAVAAGVVWGAVGLLNFGLAELGSPLGLQWGFSLPFWFKMLVAVPGGLLIAGVMGPRRYRSYY